MKGRSSSARGIKRRFYDSLAVQWEDEVKILKGNGDCAFWRGRARHVPEKRQRNVAQHYSGVEGGSLEWKRGGLIDGVCESTAWTVFRKKWKKWIDQGDKNEGKNWENNSKLRKINSVRRLTSSSYGSWRTGREVLAGELCR